MTDLSSHTLPSGGCLNCYMGLIPENGSHSVATDAGYETVPCTAHDWRVIETAPKDRPINVCYANGDTDVVEWEEYRCCMLGPRAGSYPPGWQCVENKLPVDPPDSWKPL